MNRITLLVTFLLLLTACSSTDDSVATSSDGQPTPMAMALEELVTKDHTFGSGPPPFSEYLIQSATDPGAGGVSSVGAARPLTADEQAAIEAAIAPIGAVRWIDDPDEWRTETLEPTIAGAAILGVGEPRVDGDQALVPVSLWCGGLCGTWLTYQLELVDGAWQVIGVDGPIAIS